MPHLPPHSSLLDSAQAALIEQVAQTIARFQMFSPGDKVLVGASGGPDSTALIHILQILAPELEIEIALAHLNHGLRPRAAEMDAAFVKNLAVQRHLTCYTDKIVIESTRGSIEQRARRARYAFFKQIAQTYGYSKIALGHHADDNAETVLLHFLRGSGTRGLAGIPPMRDNCFVRPLIQLKRKQILAFLEKLSINYVTDDTNTDLRFQRNRVRHELMPLLQREYNPNLVAGLNRLATLCREEQQWADTMLDRLLDQIQVHTENDCLILPVTSLAGLPGPVQRRILRRVLRQWRSHCHAFSMDHIEALRNLLQPDRDQRQLSLPEGLTALRQGDFIRIITADALLPASVDPAPAYFYRVSLPDCNTRQIDIPQADCCLCFSLVPTPKWESGMLHATHTAWFDADKLKFPLIIRNFQPGDRLAPYGLQGTQKLKKLFIDRKIPVSQRRFTPLLVSGDTIVWVAGLRRSAAALVDETTTRVLQVRIRSLT